MRCSARPGAKAEGHLTVVRRLLALGADPTDALSLALARRLSRDAVAAQLVAAGAETSA